MALSGADRTHRPVCPRQPAKNHNTSINCITLSQILLDNINKVHYTQYHTLQVLKSTNDRYRIITVSEFTKIQTGLSQTDQHSELRLSLLPLCFLLQALILLFSPFVIHHHKRGWEKKPGCPSLSISSIST